MATPSPIKGRYDRTAVLGKGGMGVVYRAYDRELKRDVALKMMLDSSDSASFELFRRECAVLASLNHPNIIDIYDIGEIREEDQQRPFFVMPLLQGATLDSLIRDAPQRLSVEHCVEIITQACRGLQAAHERGLLHRDLKPSNLFVLNDDSVKIIDFGVASLVGKTTSAGARGTLLYMAPEQTQHKACTAQSDIYSLGVTCFEALTRRLPFSGRDNEELAQAVLHDSPPPASELNPSVSGGLSQAVHAAMAKQPFRRYASAREFAETLQKALHNQPIERFDPARVLPRVNRAEKAFEDGEYDFAAEILGELDAEGHLHPAIRPLARRIDQARRGKLVAQLFDAARRRCDEQEYALALQKAQEALHLDPNHAGALALEADIKSKRSAQQIENWFELAHRHIENGAFGPARQALENVIEHKPAHSTALRLLTEIGRREQEYLRARQQKEEIYEEALGFWRKGEVTAAVSRLEKVLELDRNSPDRGAPERSSAYQDLYNQACSESNAVKAAYEEARHHIAKFELAEATAICEKWLAKYPAHALFQSLSFDIADARRQQLSADIARVDRELEIELDLDRRVKIIAQAAAAHPGETYFEKLLSATTVRRDIVNAIVSKARALEDRGAYSDALAQWEILRSVYDKFPGIDIECERIQKRREQKARAESKAAWISRIDSVLDQGDHAKALALVQEALAEFPNDPEIEPLEQLARQSIERRGEAGKWLDQGLEASREGRYAEGIGLLRRAHECDAGDQRVRSALIEALLKQASTELDRDWAAAEVLVNEISSLDQGTPRLRSLSALLADQKEEAVVSHHLSRARTLQVSRELGPALAEVEQGLFAFPEEPRLIQLKGALTRAWDETARGRPAPAMLRTVVRMVETPVDRAAVEALLQRTSKMPRAVIVARAAAAGVAPPKVAVAPPVILEPPPVKENRAPAEQGIISATEVLGGLAPPPVRPSEKETASASGPAPAPSKAGFDLLSKLNLKALSKLDLSRLPKVNLNRLSWLTRPSIGDWRWIAIFTGLIIAVALVFPRHRRDPLPPPPPRPVPLPIQLNITPAEAHVFRGDQDMGTSRSLTFPADGTYLIDVSLEGYTTKQVPIEVEGGRPRPVAPIALEPLTHTFRLEMGTGKAQLNDEMVSTELGVPSKELAPGDYTLKLSQNGGAATIAFRITPGAMPQISEIKTSSMTVTAVTTLGKHVRLWGDGVSSSTDLPDMAPGPQLISTGKEGGMQVQAEIAAFAPSIQVFVTDPMKAPVVIASNEDDATILINGRPSGDIRKNKRILYLKPGTYTFEVEKFGFVNPPPQKVRIEQGAAEQTISFTLTRNAATLAVTDAPGARIFVDGVDRGIVPATGALDLTITPGVRKISVRRAGFENTEFERDFRVGDRVPFSGGELKAMAKVVLTVTPPSTRVTATRKGDRTAVPLQPGTNILSAGEYDLAATASGYSNETKPVTARSGQSMDVTFTLKEIVSKKGKEIIEREVVKGDIKDLSGAWKDEDGGWFGLGAQDGYSLLKPDLVGTVTFEVRRKKPPGKFSLLAKEKATWVAFFLDPKRHVLFEFESGQLTATEVWGDLKKPKGRIQVDKTAEQVTIQLSRDRVECQIGGSTPLVVTPDAAMREGKFGFRGPIGIRNFHFQGVAR